MLERCFAFSPIPSSFKCTKENVQYLRKLRKWFEGYPVSIELRDYSWYSDEFLERTRNFMSRAAFSLAIIDEPQLLNTTIPFDPFVTNPNFALFDSMVGMRKDGKQMIKSGVKRTLYRYSEKELQELAHEVKVVDSKTKEVGVILIIILVVMRLKMH